MAFDVNLMLRKASDGAITSNTNGTSKDFGAGDRLPVTYELNCSAVSGTSPTLDVKIQESDDGSTWRDFIVFKQITGKGVSYVTGKSDARYRRAVFTVGGTSPNFTVSLGPVAGGLGGKY
jgi:hypothetical protein